MHVVLDYCISLLITSGRIVSKSSPNHLLLILTPPRKGSEFDLQLSDARRLLTTLLVEGIGRDDDRAKDLILAQYTAQHFSQLEKWRR